MICQILYIAHYTTWFLGDWIMGWATFIWFTPLPRLEEFVHFIKYGIWFSGLSVVLKWDALIHRLFAVKLLERLKTWRVGSEMRNGRYRGILETVESTIYCRYLVWFYQDE